MSDIRFNTWLHQSGTGGITQVDGGHVGIGTTNPDIAVHTANAKKVNVGIVTANSVYAGNYYGNGSNLTGLNSDKIEEGDTKVEVVDSGDQYIVGEVNGSERIRVDSTGKITHTATTNNTATLDLYGGNTTVSAVGEVNAQLRFRSKDDSVTNAEENVGGSIKSIVEYSNGAYVGLSFETYKQDRTPRLQEAVRIRHNGRVGINSSTPSHDLDIVSSSNAYIKVLRSGNNPVYFGNAGGEGVIECNGATFIKAGGAERLRVKTDGIKITSANAHGSAIQMYNTDSSSNVWYVNGEGNSFIGHTYPRSDGDMDLGFHTGYRWRDLIVSGGVRFGASADAHYLDDYEEGTWTPTINVGTFTTFLTNRYIKIGRQVHLHGGLIFNNNTSSTRVEISNIPFTAQNSQYVGNVWLRRTSTGERNWNMVLGEAGTNIMGIFRDSNGNDMGGHLSYSDFQHSSTYFNYSITYISSS